ncbi:MAG TPA: hypothetical protein VFQ77_21485 [Pseudonocardiaceae bacterium]|jgi:hypothetical protein|nr:hypothetical protein [Pseudonocardiaceae bacterium]
MSRSGMPAFFSSRAASRSSAAAAACARCASSEFRGAGQVSGRYVRGMDVDGELDTDQGNGMLT